MPKTNEQIHAEYAALPWYSKLGTAAADIFSIGGNSLTFGGTNAVARALVRHQTGLPDSVVGPAQDEVMHESRVRAGLAGDAMNVGGMLYGGRGVLAAGKAGLNAVRAAPTVATLARTAGPGTALRYVTGTAGPGLVPVAARALPSLGTIGKAAGLATLLGLSISGRQDATPAAPVATPQKAAAPKAQVAAPMELSPQDRQLAALDTILRSPNKTLSDLTAVTGMLPRPKQTSTKDALVGQTAQLSQAIFQAQVSDATKLHAEGKITEDEAKAMNAKALEAHFQRQAGIVGLNPLNLVQAQLMNPGEEQQ